MVIEQIALYILWLSLAGILWTNFGYFIFLRLVLLFTRRRDIKQEYYPEVSIVITAFNEEKNIESKIENCLNLIYPKEKLEIIIVSDGSTDKTEDIVRSYQSRGVILLAMPSRFGKHHSQGKGIEIAKNDIIILTDATTFLEANAVQKIVRNFADPKIGCVSGFDEIRNPDGTIVGENIYVRYEMKLRSLESEFNSLVGVSGSFYAVRKELCSDWISDISNDFYIPIVAKMRGYRGVLDNDAIGYYQAKDQSQNEFKRKTRTVCHGIEVFMRFKAILNIFKYGSYSLQMISHKLMRWLVPFFMILVFIANLFLIHTHPFYFLMMIAQICFYAIATLAAVIVSLKNLLIFRIPFYFVMANTAILAAWFYYVSGESFTIWEPTKR